MADDLNTTRRSDDVTTNTGRTDAVRSTSDPDFDNTRNVTRDNAAKDTNPDAITGAPGSHPVGTGVGAAAAGAAGAAIGSVIPGAGTVVGGVVGAVVGAVAGGLAGKGVAEAINPTAEDEYWRNEHRNRDYYTPGADYDRDYAPAYRYGYTAAGQHTGRAWDDVEGDMASGWDKTKGKSTLAWEKAKHATRDAWDRATHRHHDTGSMSSSAGASNYDTGSASSSSMSSMPDTRGTTGAGSMGGTGSGTGDMGMGSSVSGNTASTNSAGTERRDLEDNTGKRFD